MSRAVQGTRRKINRFDIYKNSYIYDENKGV